RAVPIGDFHLLPGNTPQRENVLEPGDLITHVTLPPPVAGSKQLYLKLRDRASYEFALASAAVLLTLSAGEGTPARLPPARPPTRSRPSWASRPTRRAFEGRPTRRCAARNRRVRTDSRSSWRSAVSRTRCGRPRRADPREERPCRQPKESSRRHRSAATLREW